MSPRRVVSSLLQNSQVYLHQRQQRMESERLEKTAKDWLRDYILAEGEEDYAGNKVLLFDEPILIGDTVYTGIMARRNDAPYLDTEAAEAWLAEHGLLDELRVEVPATFYYDWEYLYVLNQEGKVPDEVMDTFEEHRITWSIWPRK